MSQYKLYQPIRHDEMKEEDDSPYCKECGGCGEVGCDGIVSFLEKHVRGKTDCMYEESYIEDIIEAYKVLKELP